MLSRIEVVSHLLNVFICFIFDKMVANNASPRHPSVIGFKGISRKTMIFALVASGNIIDQYIIGSGNSIRTVLIMFYLANEGISIIENAGKVGLPLPEKFKNIFSQLTLTEKDKK